MKKLSFIITVLIFAITAQGQTLDNEFYFRFGYSSPSWKQFDGTEQDWKDEGFNYKFGGSFDVGTIFMIQSIPAAENMALGINVDYVYFNYSQFYNSRDFSNQNLAHLQFGSKIGPSFSYSPGQRMAFDVYAKANIAWMSGAVYFEDGVDNADDFYFAKPTVGFSGGLNIRYSVLMIGIEFETISPKLESDDNPGTYLGNINSDSEKSSLPCVNFSFGFSF